MLARLQLDLARTDRRSQIYYADSGLTYVFLMLETQNNNSERKGLSK